MGSPLGEIARDSDEAQVKVTISKPFKIMTKEITQSQWFEVMGDNPSYFKESKYCGDHQVINGVGLCPNNPVEQVSWNDVQRYIKKLNDANRMFRLLWYAPRCLGLLSFAHGGGVGVCGEGRDHQCLFL